MALPRVGDVLVTTTLVQPEATIPEPVAPPRPTQSGGAIAGHVAFAENYTNPAPVTALPYLQSENLRVTSVEYTYDTRTSAVNGVTVVIASDWHDS